MHLILLVGADGIPTGHAATPESEEEASIVARAVTESAETYSMLGHVREADAAHKRSGSIKAGERIAEGMIPDVR